MTQMDQSLNVYGAPLIPCSTAPMTGFFRDGFCNTCEQDQGSHTVCAVMTEEFLAFSKYVGNDLSTPRPEFNFVGLKAGDQGCAPLVNLNATHMRALEIVPLAVLEAHSAA